MPNEMLKMQTGDKMQTTTIDWTRWWDAVKGIWRKGYVWNFISGCTKVSEGCMNCYAEALTRRFKSRYPDGFELKILREKLQEPLNRKALPSGAKVFVNSMSDLFHPRVPFELIDEAFGIMAMRSDVTFSALTPSITFGR